MKVKCLKTLFIMSFVIMVILLMSVLLTLLKKIKMENL